MKHVIGWVMVIALAAPLPALARHGRNGGFVDLYYVPQAKIDVNVLGDDDGDGFGFRGLVRAGDSFAVTAEYQSLEYDDSEIENGTLRLGLGLTGRTTSGVFVEYIDSSNDLVDYDGFGIHGRLVGDISDSAELYGDLGYLKLTDEDDDRLGGLEFTVGLVVKFAGGNGVFVDYRASNLEYDDIDVEIDFTDLRIGFRLDL